MEEFADLQCPFCGQTLTVAIDPRLARQHFTTDCEVCCRPIEIHAECEGGEILNLEVTPG